MKKRKINFTPVYFGSYKETGNRQPELILVVNLNLEEAEHQKEFFSQAQVIACHGGKKQFSSFLTVVRGVGEENHDYYYYDSWNKFFELIGQELPAQKKFFRRLQNYPEQGDWFQFIRENQGFWVEDEEIKLKRQEKFQKQLLVSRTYLDWYLRWLERVNEMIFSCRFTYPIKTKKQRKEKVWRLIVPYKRLLYNFWGLEIFNVEDQAIFNFDGGAGLPAELFGGLKATVVSANEAQLVFCLEKLIPRHLANRLISFQKVNFGQLTETQNEICVNISETVRETREEGGQSKMNQLPIPFQVLAGFQPAHHLTSDPFTHFNFSKPEQVFFRDQSQVEALVNIFNCERYSAVNLIAGSPGSGKTLVQAIGARQFFQKDKIVLVVSHSNPGLDNLLEQIISITGRYDDYTLFRLGNNLQTVKSSLRSYHRLERFKKEKRPHLAEVKAIKKLLNEEKGVIIGVTLNSFSSDKTLKRIDDKKKLRVDTLFFDEATRAFLFELLPVLTRVREKIVMTGDPRQLGNIEISCEAKEFLLASGQISEPDILEFNRGIFATFFQQGLLPASPLKINRRSLRNIVKIVNTFYEEELVCGRFDANSEGRIVVYDTSRAQGVTNGRKGTSWFNIREANLAASEMAKAYGRGAKFDGVAGITPYQPQIHLTRKKLRKKILFGTNISQEKMEEEILPNVDTVDAFQGSERKTIILSMVRSNDEGDIGFNDDERRINVSLSRARDELIIIINMKTFRESGCSSKILAALESAVALAKSQGNYHLVR